MKTPTQKLQEKQKKMMERRNKAKSEGHISPFRLMQAAQGKPYKSEDLRGKRG